MKAAAHPRSRGENEVGHVRRTVLHGSSPLTRGKRGQVVASAHMCGLIPAHAGKTGDCRAYPACSTAHPRSRGENERSRFLTWAGPGSSPLTRGKPVRMAFKAAPGRLIPAHAGKTCSARFNPSLAAAHPRSRGENSPIPLALNVRMGSSPLTRGKPAIARTHLKRLGLIPAHAGKTLPAGQ